MRKWSNISPYMRRPLVLYDLATVPSGFPYIWGKFCFLFYHCSDARHSAGGCCQWSQSDALQKGGGGLLMEPLSWCLHADSPPPWQAVAWKSGWSAPWLSSSRRSGRCGLSRCSNSWSWCLFDSIMTSILQPSSPVPLTEDGGWNGGDGMNSTLFLVRRNHFSDTDCLVSTYSTPCF